MSLSTKLNGQLNSLGADYNGPAVVEVAERKLICHISRIDTLAIATDRLTLVTTELASVSMEEVERLSGDLSARLTYLMEPIAPIERDSQQCVIQLRSNPPQHDDDGRKYYELVVRCGGELTLLRYQKQEGSPRVSVPAVLSREALLRLVSDFEAALDELAASE